MSNRPDFQKVRQIAAAIWKKLPHRRGTDFGDLISAAWEGILRAERRTSNPTRSYLEQAASYGILDELRRISPLTRSARARGVELLDGRNLPADSIDADGMIDKIDAKRAIERVGASRAMAIAVGAGCLPGYGREELAREWGVTSSRISQIASQSRKYIRSIQCRD